ncbi:MAG TPA: hypothetical protein VF867_01145 [Arthrobacter sp.]
MMPRTAQAAHAARVLPCSGPVCRFLRGPFRNERGETLVEVIIAMAMTFTLIAGFSGAYINANKIMKVSVSETVADQASSALIEKARAAPWSTVGIAGNPVTPGTPPTDGSIVQGGSFAASSVVTLHGLAVTLTSSIKWTKAPVDGTSYGTKTLNIDASWQDRAGDTSAQSVHTIHHQAILTPGIDQAAPSGVRGGS